MVKADQKEEIRSLRESLGMTQDQFARAVGVSFSTVSRWETGRGSPSPLARRRVVELRANMAEKEESE